MERASGKYIKIFALCNNTLLLSGTMAFYELHTDTCNIFSFFFDLERV
jgi:hypothetical protein